MIPTLILDELQALLEKATPGPWNVVAGDDHYIEADSIPAEYPHRFLDDDLGRFVALIGNRPEDFGMANAELIAAMHKHLPTLIAAARQLEEVRRDAERYRYLRSNMAWERGAFAPGARWLFPRHLEGTLAEQLDQSIDAQLGEENG